MEGKSGRIISNRLMEQRNLSKRQVELDELFWAYRAVCPDPDPGAYFLPTMCGRIEAREVSTNWFGRAAKLLVMAAVAASVILGMMIPSRGRPQSAFFNATFVEALQADHASSSLEPFHHDRISELEAR